MVRICTSDAVLLPVPASLSFLPRLQSPGDGEHKQVVAVGLAACALMSQCAPDRPIGTLTLPELPAPEDALPRRDRARHVSDLRTLQSGGSVLVSAEEPVSAERSAAWVRAIMRRLPPHNSVLVVSSMPVGRCTSSVSTQETCRDAPCFDDFVPANLELRSVWLQWWAVRGETRHTSTEGPAIRRRTSSYSRRQRQRRKPATGRPLPPRTAACGGCHRAPWCPDSLPQS